MNSLNKIWDTLWKDKPLLIAVALALAALVYVLYKNSSGSAVTAQASDTMQSQGAGPGPGTGTFVEYSYYNNTPITNTTSNVTTNSAPIAAPPAQAPASPGKPAVAPPPKSRTVTVTPWPTQNSTLYGIAKSVYGDGNQWPKIYSANKSKIGNNPNLIYAGTVLTIP